MKYARLQRPENLKPQLYSRIPAGGILRSYIKFFSSDHKSVSLLEFFRTLYIEYRSVSGFQPFGHTESQEGTSLGVKLLDELGAVICQ